MLKNFIKSIQSALPLILIIIGILAISSSTILIRFSQENVPSLTIAVYRLLVASLLLLPFVIRKNKTEISNLSRRDLFYLLLSGLFLAFHFASWITSLEFTSVTSSVVLVTTSPIWVTLFTMMQSKGSIKKPLLMGLVLVLMGGFIVATSQTIMNYPSNGLSENPFRGFSQSNLKGNLLALCGSFCAAGYLLIGKKMRAKTTITTYSFLVYGMAAIILLIAALLFRLQLIGFQPVDYLLLVAIAVFPQLIGHSIFNWSLAYLSVSFVSVALLGEPIGTSILAFFILRETPSWVELVGGILILSGLFVASRAETLPKKIGVE